MNKFKKIINSSKFKLFIMIFIISCIITYPTFLYSPFMDTYCNMDVGHFSMFEHFISNGRLFSALVFLVAYLTKMPFSVLNIISPLGANLFLTGAILCVYNEMSKEINSKKTKLFILITSFIIFYVPFVIELFLFDEVLVMCSGIFFAVLAAKKINEDNFKSYLLALIYTVISVFCYQACICFLIPIILLFSVKKSSGNIKNDLLKIIKKLFLAFVFYGLAFVIDLILVVVGNNLFNNGTEKVGKINLSKNISYINSNLLPYMFKTLYGYINVKLYYIIFLVTIIFSIVGILQNKNKLFNILILFGIVISAILMPIVPNMFMSSDLNYLEARQSLTFVSIPGMIGLLVLTKFSLSNNYLFNTFIMFLSLIFIIYSYLFIVNLKQDYNRYYSDMDYLHNVQKAISKYEKESNYKVKNVFMVYDLDYSKYYKSQFQNLSSLKSTAIGGWALNCSMNAYSDNNYKFKYKKNDDKIYQKLYKRKKYNYFNEKQLYFEKDSLYLLAY